MMGADRRRVRLRYVGVGLITTTAIAFLLLDRPRRDEIAFVMVERAPLRKVGNAEAEVLGYLTTTDSVVVLRKVGNWSKVRYQHLVGYVFGSYLSPYNHERLLRSQQTSPILLRRRWSGTVGEYPVKLDIEQAGPMLTVRLESPTYLLQVPADIFYGSIDFRYGTVLWVSEGDARRGGQLVFSGFLTDDQRVIRGSARRTDSTIRQPLVLHASEP